MLAGIHQPNYMPYYGFFHKVANCDMFVLMDTVQFVKTGPFGWQPRNKIRTKWGWIWLTVPVLSKGRFSQKICDVDIDNTQDWRRKHWGSIYYNYKNTPYFNKYSDFFESVYKKNWHKLVDLNLEIILYLLKALKITTKISKSSKLAAEGQNTHLLIDICKKIGATAYLSGMHGKDYMDADLIKKSGLKTIFQNFNCPVYDQGYSDFIPNLSIVDLLFHKGDEAVDLILNKQEDVKLHV